MADPKNDEEAIARIQNGDREAFSFLVDKYQKYVFGICLARCRGQEADAKDLTQEVLVRVYRGIQTFRRESTFKTWVSTIAHNAASNAMNKEKRLPSPTDPEQLAETVQAATSVEEDTATRDTLSVIEKAILNLPLKQREVANAKWLAGLSWDEVASVIGVQVGTARARLLSARKTICERLKGVFLGGGSTPDVELSVHPETACGGESE